MKGGIRRILLIGAGHAHAVALKYLGLRPIPEAKLTLVTRQRHTLYSGMLPGLIAGRYGFGDAHIDAASLCAFAGAEFHQGEATGIDLETRCVICRDGKRLPFDILSIDSGSLSNMSGVRGAAEFAVPVKPIDGFSASLREIEDGLRAAAFTARIAVVGAGAGGTELMLSLERRLRREAFEAGRSPLNLEFFLVAGQSDILTEFPVAMRRRFREICSTRGISIVASSPIKEVSGGGVVSEAGEFMSLDVIFWATEGVAPAWLTATGLKLDAKGFVRVYPTLESISHPMVFAAGDTAQIEGHALPRSGVYAVRQGPVLAKNLRRAVLGLPLKSYRPQKHALSLLTTGDAYAIGTRNGFTFEGAWVWRWKDWIDRRFVRSFRNLNPAP